MTSHPRDFYFDLTTGGYKHINDIHKFGRNIAVGTTFEAVTTSGLYPMPTALTSLEILSSSANDGAGTEAGAETVLITGISTDWEEITETVTLNGTTPVALTNQFYRVYDMRVVTTNTYATTTTGSHIGDITLRVAGAGATWAVIDDVATYPRGESQIGAYTVPKGKVAYLKSVFVYVNSNKIASVSLYERRNANDVVAPYTAALAHMELDGVIGVGAYDSSVPLGPFNEYTDLFWLAKVPATTAEVSVHFDIILINKTDQ